MTITRTPRKQRPPEYGSDAERILLEVTLGKSPATSDTPEQAVLRAKLAAEVQACIRAGHEVRIPS